jgi:hypothetical protein
VSVLDPRGRDKSALSTSTAADSVRRLELAAHDLKPIELVEERMV